MDLGEGVGSWEPQVGGAVIRSTTRAMSSARSSAVMRLVTDRWSASAMASAEPEAGDRADEVDHVGLGAVVRRREVGDAVGVEHDDVADVEAALLDVDGRSRRTRRAACRAGPSARRPRRPTRRPAAGGSRRRRRATRRRPGPRGWRRPRCRTGRGPRGRIASFSQSSTRSWPSEWRAAARTV